MKKILILFLFFFAIVSCGGDKFAKSPLDNFVRDFYNVKSYSVILHDMEVEGTFASTYMHQYRIIKVENNEPVEEVTDWFEVSKQFFEQNKSYMGMELLSKDSTGKVRKVPSPPGYSNYVGNRQYGHWVNRGGYSFWEFYGQYAMFSRMFGMDRYPIRRDYYSDYRTSYYNSNRPYFGRTSTGGQRWGTNGEYLKKTRPTSKWAKASSRTNAFSNKKAFSGSGSSSSSSKSSRSGSRYSSSFSSRSRSGGFGK